MLTVNAIMTSAYLIGKGGFFVQIASAVYADLSEQYKGKINYPKIYFQQFLLQLFLLSQNFFDKSPLFLAILGISSAFLIYGFIKGDVQESVEHKDLNQFKHQLAILNRLLGLGLLATIVFNIAQVHFLMMIGSIGAFLPILIKEIINLDSKNKIFSEKTKSRLLTSLKYLEYFNNFGSVFFIATSSFSFFTFIPFCISVLLKFNPEKTLKSLIEFKNKVNKAVSNFLMKLRMMVTKSKIKSINEFFSSLSSKDKEKITKENTKATLQSIELRDQMLSEDPSCATVKADISPVDVLNCIESFKGSKNPIQWNISSLMNDMFSQELHFSILGQYQIISADKLKAYAKKKGYDLEEIINLIQGHDHELKVAYLNGLKKLITLDLIDQEREERFSDKKNLIKKEDIAKDLSLLLSSNIISKLLPSVMQEEMTLSLINLNKELITKMTDFSEKLSFERQARIKHLMNHLSYYVALELERILVSLNTRTCLTCNDHLFHYNDLLDLICLFQEAIDLDEQDVFFNLIERYESTIMMNMPIVIKSKWNENFVKEIFCKKTPIKKVEKESFLNDFYNFLKEHGENVRNKEVANEISLIEHISMKAEKDCFHIIKNNFLIIVEKKLGQSSLKSPLKKMIEKIDNDFITMLDEQQLMIFIDILKNIINDQNEQSDSLNELNREFNFDNIYEENPQFNNSSPSCDSLAQESLSSFLLEKSAEEKLLKVMNGWARTQVGTQDSRAKLQSTMQRAKQKEKGFFEKLSGQYKSNALFFKYYEMVASIEVVVIKIQEKFLKIKDSEYWVQWFGKKTVDFEAHKTAQSILQHSSLLPFLSKADIQDPVVKENFFNKNHNEMKALDYLFIEKFSDTTYMIESIVDVMFEFQMLDIQVFNLEDAIKHIIDRFEKNITNIELPFNATNFQDIIDQNLKMTLNWADDVTLLSIESKNNIKNIFRFYIIKHFLDTKLWTIDQLQYDCSVDLQQYFDIKKEATFSEKQINEKIKSYASAYKHSGQDVKDLLGPAIGIISYSCRSFFSPAKIEKNLENKRSVFE